MKQMYHIILPLRQIFTATRFRLVAVLLPKLYNPTNAPTFLDFLLHHRLLVHTIVVGRFLFVAQFTLLRTVTNQLGQTRYTRPLAAAAERLARTSPITPWNGVKRCRPR